jgi:hypothetical protein
MDLHPPNDLLQFEVVCVFFYLVGYGKEDADDKEYWTV